MKRVSSKAAKALLACPLVAAGLLGFQIGAVPAAAHPTVVAQAQCGDLSGYQKVNLSPLPPEAKLTVDLVKQGGPFPYPQDGQVWTDRESTLPQCGADYYHEYTVRTPGIGDRGTRRFVVGRGGEYFYTDDHYASFKLTNINA
jgi:ribonuclease T1